MQSLRERPRLSRLRPEGTRTRREGSTSEVTSPIKVREALLTRQHGDAAHLADR